VQTLPLKYRCVINLTLITISYSKEELKVIVVNFPPVVAPNLLQISTLSIVETRGLLLFHIALNIWQHDAISD